MSNSFAHEFTTGVVVAILSGIGIIGWAVIETLLWLLSFITISFGG